MILSVTFCRCKATPVMENLVRCHFNDILQSAFNVSTLSFYTNLLRKTSKHSMSTTLLRLSSNYNDIQSQFAFRLLSFKRCFFSAAAEKIRCNGLI